MVDKRHQIRYNKSVPSRYEKEFPPLGGGKVDTMESQGELVRVQYDVVLRESGRHVRSAMDVRVPSIIEGEEERDPTIICVWRLMHIYKNQGGIALNETTAWVAEK